MQDIERAAEPGELWSVELRMRAPDGYLQLTTDGEKAYHDERLDLLNTSHPLVRTAARSLEGLLEEPVARVGGLLLRREGLEDELEPGIYFLAVFVVEVRRVQDRRFV